MELEKKFHVETKRQYFETYLITKGLKKRCRKADIYTDDLGLDLPLDYTETQFNEVVTAAKAKLASQYKQVFRAVLKLNFTESEGYIKSFQLFDKRHKEIDLV